MLEKFDPACRQDDNGQSHLHRLIVKPDSPVKVEINQNEIYSGSMNDDWELLKPKITPDLDDKEGQPLGEPFQGDELRCGNGL